MHSIQKTILTALLLTFGLFSASAEERTIALGGKAGWPALSVSSGISRGRGWLGYEALILDSSASPEGTRNDAATGAPATREAVAGGRSADRGKPVADDLRLSFDSPDPADDAGKYEVVSSKLLHAGASLARHGTGVASCNTDTSGLILRGKQGSLFATPGMTGSFHVEFWMLPAVTESGSVLFQWRSSRTARGKSLYQFIRADIMRNRLEWKFSNVWADASGKGMDVVLSGSRNLVPGTWSHHALSYDDSTGLLEYRLDGSVEDMKFVTSTGREAGDILPAILGSPSDLEIAPRFSGLVDEFIIRKTPPADVTLEGMQELLGRYPASGGRFESMPLDSGGIGSVLKLLEIKATEPAETGTAFFVRAGDNFYQWTDSSPAWVPVVDGEPVGEIRGRYFQVAGELYTDGRALKTPIVSSVTLRFVPDDPPWPPVRVFADPGDGSAVLRWAASVDHDTEGYLVYYGERPGEYLSSGSPLDAGKVLECRIPGLKNGKLYYFAVSAYDREGKAHSGALSGEAFARPRAVRSGANGDD